MALSGEVRCNNELFGEHNGPNHCRRGYRQNQRQPGVSLPIANHSELPDIKQPSMSDAVTVN